MINLSLSPKSITLIVMSVVNVVLLTSIFTKEYDLNYYNSLKQKSQDIVTMREYFKTDFKKDKYFNMFNKEKSEFYFKNLTNKKAEQLLKEFNDEPYFIEKIQLIKVGLNKYELKVGVKND